MSSSSERHCPSQKPTDGQLTCRLNLNFALWSVWFSLSASGLLLLINLSRWPYCHGSDITSAGWSWLASSVVLKWPLLSALAGGVENNRQALRTFWCCLHLNYQFLNSNGKFSCLLVIILFYNMNISDPCYYYHPGLYYIWITSRYITRPHTS